MARWLRVLLVLVAALTVLWVVFFFSNGTPATPFVFDLAAVRALADAPADQLPTEVRVERVSSGELPRFFVVSANPLTGWYPAVYSSFQLTFADHRSIVVDTAYDRATWKQIDGTLSVFDDAAYARVEQAMAAATHVVVTHEHPDHVAGLAAARDPVSRRHARLTPEQLGSVPAFLLAGLAGIEPFTYGPPTRLEPGVVLVRAPGHSPGSQLIYVRRADGQELLFIGDIAWNHDNLERARVRPRFSSLYLGEDRDAVTAQLEALRVVERENPNLAIVIAHDRRQLDEFVRRGVVREGFADAREGPAGATTAP